MKVNVGMKSFGLSCNYALTKGDKRVMQADIGLAYKMIIILSS